MPTPLKQAMYVALELSAAQWKLVFSNGEKHRIVNIDARNTKQLVAAIAQAKEKLRVAQNAPVYSCYEAGRDGFWLHRWLESHGLKNRVVDPSAIQVTRRAKHTKTDRIDGLKLVAMLIRDVGGEPRVWRVCRVPTEWEEDDRQPQRELLALQEDHTRVRNQIAAMLMRFGLRLAPARWPRSWNQLRQPNGEPLPPRLVEQLERARVHYEFLEEQLRAVNREREARLRQALSLTRKESSAPTPELVHQRQVATKVLSLTSLRGIGLTSACLFVAEFFGWRHFRNRREVGAAAGLDGTPFNSGQSAHDQGISKAGNRRIRSMAIEIAWQWLRYQPHSALSRWYFERVNAGGQKGLKKKAITAVARRLLIQLWRFLEQGVVPDGATIKKQIALR